MKIIIYIYEDKNLISCQSWKKNSYRGSRRRSRGPYSGKLTSTRRRVSVPHLFLLHTFIVHCSDTRRWVHTWDPPVKTQTYNGKTLKKTTSYCYSLLSPSPSLRQIIELNKSCLSSRPLKLLYAPSNGGFWYVYLPLQTSTNLR